MSVVQFNESNLFPSLNSVFEDLLNERRDFFNSFKNRITMPPVNVSETDDMYKLELAIPGKSKDDFNIEINENAMIITSENESQSENDETDYKRKEYSFQSFQRSFILPENASKDKVYATYVNGVLNIEIEKIQNLKKQTKTISIN